MLLSASRSMLLVSDVQERLAPATLEPEPVIANCGRLMDAAVALDVPILLSEHYPKGIGRTVAPLRERAPEGAIVEKIHFSCAAEPRFAARVRELGRRQIIVAGMEAHVCVLQTALGFAAEGRDVFVVADAVTSRTAENRERALARLARCGVGVVTVEMVLFEWLHRGDVPAFRKVLNLIK